MELFLNLYDASFQTTSRTEKGKSILSFPSRYCVVDTETTGLSPEWNDIIEIGAIRYIDGKEVARFQTLVKPYESEERDWVDDFIAELTGITNDMLVDAPLTEVAIKAFSEFLGEDDVVGYNVNFDINFLYDCYMKHLGFPMKNDFIDVMRLARRLYPNLVHHRLRDMAKVFNIEYENAHRALSDVIATQACFLCLQNEANNQYGSLEEFLRVCKKKKYYGGVDARDIKGDETKNNPDSPLYMKYCVFTGVLEKMERKQAMQIVADLGGINENSVTKKTNYLILGNNDYCKTIKGGKSNKHKQAEAYKLQGQDIEIIPEAVFYDMLGDELPAKKQELPEPENTIVLSIENKGVSAYVTKMLTNETDISRLRFEITSTGLSLVYPYKLIEFSVLKRWTIRVTYRTEDGWSKEEVDNLSDILRYKDMIIDLMKKHESGFEWYDRPQNKKHYRTFIANTFQIREDEIESSIEEYLCAQNKFKEEQRIKAEEKMRLEAERAQRRLEREQRKAEEAERKTNSDPNKGTKRKIAQYNDEMILIAEYESLSEASKAINVNAKSIREAATGKQKHAAGFVWRYIDEGNMEA